MSDNSQSQLDTFKDADGETSEDKWKPKLTLAIGVKPAKQQTVIRKVSSELHENFEETRWWSKHDDA